MPEIPLFDHTSVLAAVSPLVLTVSPLEVTGSFWSGRVLVTLGPSVDLPVSLVTPDCD